MNYANHLRESTLSIWNVHEHPLSPTGIESWVREVKRLSVADLESAGKPRATARRRASSITPSVTVDSDRAPLAPHYLRDFKCISSPIPHPASRTFSPPVSCSPARIIGLLAMMPGNLFPSSRNRLEKSYFFGTINGGEKRNVLGASHSNRLQCSGLFTSNNRTDADFLHLLPS